MHSDVFYICIILTLVSLCACTDEHRELNTKQFSDAELIQPFNPRQELYPDFFFEGNYALKVLDTDYKYAPEIFSLNLYKRTHTSPPWFELTYTHDTKLFTKKTIYKGTFETVLRSGYSAITAIDAYQNGDMFKLLMTAESISTVTRDSTQTVRKTVQFGVTLQRDISKHTVPRMIAILPGRIFELEESIILEGQNFQLIRFLDSQPLSGVSDWDHALQECEDYIQFYRTTGEAKELPLGTNYHPGIVQRAQALFTQQRIGDAFVYITSVFAAWMAHVDELIDVDNSRNEVVRILADETNKMLAVLPIFTSNEEQKYLAERVVEMLADELLPKWDKTFERWRGLDPQTKEAYNNLKQATIAHKH